MDDIIDRINERLGDPDKLPVRGSPVGDLLEDAVTELQMWRRLAFDGFSSQRDATAKALDLLEKRLSLK